MFLNAVCNADPSSLFLSLCNVFTLFDAASSSTAASPTDVFDDPIIIPPDLLFKSPPPPVNMEDSSISEKEGRNKHLNQIITIASTIAGAVVIFALLLFCCLMRGHSSYADAQKDDNPLLTLTSSDFSTSNLGISIIFR